MAGEHTAVPSLDGHVPVYVSVPPSGATAREAEARGPGVVVIQEWWGLVPHIQNVADRFAAEGFVAAAPDLYRGAKTTEPDEAGELLMAMALDRAAHDMVNTVDDLLARDEVTGDTVGVVGFCMGGGLALKLATLTPKVGAVSAFYGFPREGLTWDLGQIKGVVQYHQAEHDDFAPADLVEQMKAELTAAGVPNEFHLYPGTQHAFFNDERPEIHAPEASAQAWRRTLELFRANLGSA
jgi:carboxymethylenebutenolidase